MYIRYKETNYLCKCNISENITYTGLPTDFPAPVKGEIVLCADDGFIMRTDKAEDYLRQTFKDGVLMLTNTPEPIEPEPEEPSGEPTSEEILNILLGV